MNYSNASCFLKITKSIAILFFISSSFYTTAADASNKREKLEDVEESNPAKKAKLNPPVIEFFPTSSAFKGGGGNQYYAIPTYDGTFKWIMTDDNIRLSFLQTFAPNEKITSTTLLDDHLNPLKEGSVLRTLLNDKSSFEVMKEIFEDSKTTNDIYLVTNMGDEVKKTKKPTLQKARINQKGTEFIRNLSKSYNDLVQAFPKELRNSMVDLVCQTSDGTYELVEVQVIPQTGWDQRALAYVASFYGNQIRQGDQWNKLKRVVGINILGGGRGDLQHWKGKENETIRHYKFQDQYHPGYYIDGIEIIQYSLKNFPQDMGAENIPLKEWIDYLRSAHYKTPEEVEKIQTPAVKEAYEKSLYKNMPDWARELYDIEDKHYMSYSEHTAFERNEGKAEGRAEGIRETAKKMLDQKLEISLIMSCTGLTQEEIEELTSY